MIDYYTEDLAKKIKKAKETNNLERKKILKGLSRLLSLVQNFYKIIDDYEDCEEFKEISKFFSYLAQIFHHYIENCIEGENISLKKLENILDCLVYKYYFFGGGECDDGTSFLYLGKCIEEDEDEDDDETLSIPIPITKTDDWYNCLKSIN